ncbi:MAG: hypothetical protein [Bacteriophage sp.]|nr:MAG: hypothetical protein [Bacteriophage sp.]
MAKYFIHFNIRGTFNVHNIIEEINDTQYQELLDLYRTRNVVFDKNSPDNDFFDLSNNNKINVRLKNLDEYEELKKVHSIDLLLTKLNLILDEFSLDNLLHIERISVSKNIENYMPESTDQYNINSIIGRTIEKVPYDEASMYIKLALDYLNFVKIYLGLNFSMLSQFQINQLNFLAKYWLEKETNRYYLVKVMKRHLSMTYSDFTKRDNLNDLTMHIKLLGE